MWEMLRNHLKNKITYFKEILCKNLGILGDLVSIKYHNYTIDAFIFYWHFTFLCSTHFRYKTNINIEMAKKKGFLFIYFVEIQRKPTFCNEFTFASVIFVYTLKHRKKRFRKLLNYFMKKHSFFPLRFIDSFFVCFHEFVCIKRNKNNCFDIYNYFIL